MYKTSREQFLADVRRAAKQGAKSQRGRLLNADELERVTGGFRDDPHGAFANGDT